MFRCVSEWGGGGKRCGREWAGGPSLYHRHAVKGQTVL